MKSKVLFGVLAATALVACNNDEAIEVKSSGTIAFSGSFVDNATRAAADPSTTTGSIKNFDVWAFMGGPTGTILVDEDVEKNGTEWTYKNTQYWSPDQTYYFAALSPMNSVNVTEKLATDATVLNGLGTISFINADGSEDLLYAATKVTTPKQILTQPDDVKFQFEHMLSKVKFTFSNGFVNENTTLVVENIKMEVPKSASIDVAKADWKDASTWTLGADKFELEFGGVSSLISGEADECTQERLTIPADDKEQYKVTFTVKLYQGEVLAQTFEEETTVAGVALKRGYAYNFKAELNPANLGLFPITFDVEEVKDWKNPEDIDQFTEFYGGNSTIDGKQVTLVSNAILTQTLNIQNGGALIGSGYTATWPTHNRNEAQFFINNTLRFISINNGGSVKDLVIDGQNESYAHADGKTYGIRGLFITGSGDVNIDNVLVLNCTYGINTSSSTIKHLNVSNSTLQGWNSWDGTEKATFTNVKFTKGTYANVRPYHTTTFTNCVFDNVTLDLSMLEDGQTVALVNCYNADGELITADNASTIGVTDLSKLGINTSVPNVESGKTVTMTANGVAVTSVKVDNGILDGAGYTLTVAEVPGNNGVVRPEGTATVKNLTIDGQNKKYDTNKGMRAIYITKAGTYTLDNITTKDVTYAINVSTTQEVLLNVSNSTLQGWTSYGATTTAVFDHVNFTKNPVAYGNFKPYGTTILKICVFAEDVNLDLSAVVEGEVITFVDCYREITNGTEKKHVKITEENLETLFGTTNIEGYAANKVAFVSATAQAINSDDFKNGIKLTSDAIAVEKLVIESDKTIDGAGNTLTVTQATEYFLTASTLRLIEFTGNGNIQNLKIDGNNVMLAKDGKNYGIRAIFLTGSNTVYNIDNVHITDVTYCLNDGSGNGRTLNVSNSSFEGWTSYSTATSATFTKVNFTKNQDNGIGTFRPYGTTTVEECNFAGDFTFLLDKLVESGNTITFINCYVDGVRITTENVASMVENYNTANVKVENHI